MNIIDADNSIKLPVYLGQVDNWEDIVVDLNKINSLLITGVSGCGKSTMLHNIIYNMIIRTDSTEHRLIIIDQSGVEFNIYNGIPHLLTSVITDISRTTGFLNWIIFEKEHRTKMLNQKQKRNIDDYNELCDEKIPYITVIFDGYFFENNDLNDIIYEIISSGRRVGINFIITTCSTKNISELIEIIPAYACFKLTSKAGLHGFNQKEIASLKLYEFIYLDQFHTDTIRLTVPDIEYDILVEKLDDMRVDTPVAGVDFREENDENVLDEYFVQAGQLVINKNKASIGQLQRFFKIGFNRAARILDQLFEAGVVGPEEGTKPRQVLMSMEQFEEYIEKH